jgi:hypothetical protein
MNKEPVDISRFLPIGEMLRGLMEQPFIQKADLKTILRSRGVFTCNTEKSDSIPVLMATILSPSEFDVLRESQNSREDNPKRITQVVAWDSDKTLLDSLPDDIDFKKMVDMEFSSCKVDGAPEFVPVDGNPDHLRLEFDVERTNLTKSWASTKSTFPGSLELKRIKDKGEVKVVVTHTANETKQVASKATSSLVNTFKESGHISKTKDIERITFGRFSNASRIEYFLELSVETTSNILSFEEIVDLELSPDQEAELPANMDWMSNRIDDLKLNGKSLHETFFVNEKSSHEYIFLYRVDVRYSFDISGLEGSCVVSISFPEYIKSKSDKSELEISIKSMSFADRLRGITKNEVKEMLLDELETQKIEKYRNYIVD